MGCGGQGGGEPSAASAPEAKGKGTAVMTIRWPERSSARLIPNAVNSVVIKLSGVSKSFIQTIPRPTSGTTGTVAFTGLPYGGYVASIKGYPTTNGTGVAQATGTGAVTVGEDVPGSLDVALGSTVATLGVAVSGPVFPGEAATLAASAKDASGAVVLLAAGGGQESLAWTNDTPDVATLAPSGLSAVIVGPAVGTAHVTARLVVDDAGTTVAGGADVAIVATKSLDLAPTARGSFIDSYTSPRGSHFYSTSTNLVDSYSEGRGTVQTKVSRFITEFDLSKIPIGATVSSVTWSATLELSSATSHTVGLYAGDGVLNPGDYTIGSTSLGNLDSTLGVKPLDATAGIKGQISSGKRYAGFRIALTNLINNTSGSWSSPHLIVVYGPAP